MFLFVGAVVHYRPSVALGFGWPSAVSRAKNTTPHPHRAKNAAKIEIGSPQKCFGQNEGRSFIFYELREISIEPMFRLEISGGEEEAKGKGGAERQAGLKPKTRPYNGCRTVKIAGWQPALRPCGDVELDRFENP